MVLSLKLYSWQKRYNFQKLANKTCLNMFVYISRNAIYLLFLTLTFRQFYYHIKFVETLLSQKWWLIVLWSLPIQLRWLCLLNFGSALVCSCCSRRYLSPEFVLHVCQSKRGYQSTQMYTMLLLRWNMTSALSTTNMKIWPPKPTLVSVSSWQSLGFSDCSWAGLCFVGLVFVVTAANAAKAKHKRVLSWQPCNQRQFNSKKQKTASIVSTCRLNLWHNPCRYKIISELHKIINHMQHTILMSGLCFYFQNDQQQNLQVSMCCRCNATE